MAEAIQLDIGGNTTRLDRDIQKTVNKAYTINLQTKGSQPLGKITGQVNEFTKSLDASNARVIAFGASAGVIFGLKKAFDTLVTSTIEVQKSLTDINVILNVSASQLASFGGELFKIAKNTGQSFNEVAQAATEFSRQGLGVAETLKRTNEALILSRLSGLDAAKSVEALTAAVNSFASQAVTASEIVNKFANVDAAFAVSSADLADAISRVGSSAAQSGVQLDELIALVTSAQQTTARGGAVIGNSFKTIFTRLQRGKVIDLLGSLGISDTDATGNVKSTIQLLQDLARVYDSLGARQQAAIAEQVGGVFQINILKATLADLGKEYSTYNSALNVSANSTDEAIRRNESLNKTYSAQINALQQNAKQLAATAGSRLLGPAFDRVVGGANSILGGINESDGESYGAILGKGILDGLGQFIAGPGLALIGGVLLKLFKDFGKFASGGARELLGLNTAANQQRDIQKSINEILQKNPALIDLAMKGEQGMAAASAKLLSNLQAQTAQLAMQEKISAQIAAQFYASGGRVSGGIPVAPTKKGKARGFIPNFVKDGAIEKAQAIALGATQSVRPHMSKGTIGGRKFVMNNQETEYPGVGRNGDSMVIPHYAARGFIPNFSLAGFSDIVRKSGATSIDEFKKTMGGNLTQTGKSFVLNTPEGKTFSFSNAQLKEQLRRKRGTENRVYSALDLIKQNQFSNITSLPTVLTPTNPGSSSLTRTRKGLYNKKDVEFKFRARGISNPDVLDGEFENNFGGPGSNFIDNFINSSVLNPGGLVDKIKKTLEVDRPTNAKELDSTIQGYRSSIDGAIGGIFDAAISSVIGGAVNEAEQGNFDVRATGEQFKYIKKLFGPDSLGGVQNNLGDFKKNAGPDAANSMIDKTVKEYRKAFTYQKQNKATGFIPNFSSTNRGVPISQIRAHFDKSGTPIAVTNTRDEPNGLKDAIGRERKGIGMYAGGFVPNFVDEGGNQNSISSTILALSTELGGLAFQLRGSRQEYQSSLEQLTGVNRKAAQEALVNAEQEYAAAQLRLKSTTGGVRTEPGAILAAQEAKQNLLTAREDVKKAKGGFSARTKSFGSAYGGAISLALPILAETSKKFIPKDAGKGGRTASAGIDVVSQVGSMAAMGSMFGPVGIAVGAAAGALMTVPNLVEQMTTDFPELNEAAQKSSQELDRFNNAASKLQTASENLAAVMSDSQSGAEKIKKAQDAYASALGEFSIDEQKRIGGATDKKAEMEKIRGEKERAKANDEFTANIGKQAGEARKAAWWKNTGKGIVNNAAFGGSMTDPLAQAASEKIGFNPKTVAYDALGLGETAMGKDELKNQQGAFVGQLLQGKQGKDALDVLQKTRKSESFKSLAGLKPGDTEGLTKALTDMGFETKYVEQVVAEAGTGQQRFQEITLGLSQAVLQATEQTANAVKETDKQAEQDKKEADAKKAANKESEKTIAIIESNMRMAQAAAAAERALGESRRQFSRDTALADKFTRPAETVKALVGEDAPLAQKFQSRADVAGIEKSYQDGVDKLTTGLATEISGLISSSATEATKVTMGEGTAREGAKAEDITKASAAALATSEEQVQAFKDIQGILNQNIQNNGGQLDFKSLESALIPQFEALKIDGVAQQEILQKLQEGAQSGNTQLQLLMEESIQGISTLAKETSQKILIQKIGQAQKFAGGIEEYINPPKKGESTFDKAIKATKGLDKFQGQANDFAFDYQPGSNQFKYQYPEAEAARKKQAPEYGRQALKLIGGLQDYFGYTPDASGKASQAAVAGLKENLDQQVAEFQKIAANPKTPDIVKDEINNALKEVKGLGGTENIAKIQVAKKTGALSEEGFQKITGKFNDPVLEELKRTNPELAMMKAAEMIITDDPTVKAVNKTNSILVDIRKNTSEALSGEGGYQTDSEGFVNIDNLSKKTDSAPSTTNKQTTKTTTADTKAPQQTTKVMSEALRRAQNANPVPQTVSKKSISEIEQETIKKRDIPYLNSPLAPENFETGKKFQSVEEVDALKKKLESQISKDKAQATFDSKINSGNLQLSSGFGLPTSFAGGVSDNNMMKLAESEKTWKMPTSNGFMTQTPEQQQKALANQKATQRLGVLEGFSKALNPAAGSSGISAPVYGQSRRGLLAAYERANPNYVGVPNNERTTPIPAATAANTPQKVAEEREKKTSEEKTSTSTNESLMAAVKALQTAAEKLSSTIETSNEKTTETNPATPNASNKPAQGGSSQSSNIGPFNVVVNGSQGDISAQLTQALEKLKTEILALVNVKVPPTSNPQNGGGKRADGGFLL